MKKTEDKLFCKNSFITFCAIIAIAIITISLLCAFILKPSKKLQLSEFEKIAIYGYLEDHLSLDKLYLLSGKSSYNNLQYTQSKVKEILDSYYENHNEDIIPTSIVTSELGTKYNISSDTIDFHGILVSNYEYLPEQDAFKRVEGANIGLASIESQVQTDANSTDKLSITNIEKISDNSYIVYFDVISSETENVASKTGAVTISVINGSYELENCTITD